LSARPSIRRQLIWRLSGLFLLSLVLSSAIFLYQAWVNRIDNLDRSLRGAAAELVAGVELGAGPGQFRISDATAAALAPAEIASLRYAVIDEKTGAVADGSSASLAQEMGHAIGGRPADTGFDFLDAVGGKDRGYVSRVSKGGASLAILVSSTTLSLADTLAWMQDETLSELLPVLTPLFLGTLLVAPFTIRRSLRPLARLSAEAALIEPSRTDIRLAEAGVPSEILPLVSTINKALARIDEGFELQRRFTTNAAHELRTPLAILRARIDGLDDGPTKSGLTRDVDRMTRLVSQLLLAGRVEMQQPPHHGSVELAEVARETVARLAVLPMAREHELKLDLPGQPVPVGGEEEALGDALRNLVDNALAHSPPGMPVEISVGRDGSVEVRDRGPGVPPEHRKQIFERFWRARKSGGEGAGLGLSIVRAIVERYNGTVDVAENPGGGAVFRMQFQLSPPAGAQKDGAA
jgi:two-component system sensor histidine kinase TctE